MTTTTGTERDHDVADRGSRTAALMANVRRTPLFRSLVPMEAAVGWPIPVVRHGDEGVEVYVRLPLFGMQQSDAPGVAADLFPPFATITLSWRSQRVVEYVDLRHKGRRRVSTWERPAGAFPHPDVEITRGAYLELRRDLLTRYDELFDHLARGEDLAPDRTAAFSDRLRRLVEPPLLPYYRELAPRFFERFLGPSPDPTVRGAR